MCPRCARRYRAGESLDCPDCEGALQRSVDLTARNGPADDVVQAKLAVSQPGDPAEREAERVATEIVDSPEPTADAEKRIEIQRRGGASGRTVDGRTETRIDALGGGGSPLPPSTRSSFERRLGADFGDVRIHTGAHADAIARSIDAEAFTIGREIGFARGNYRPQDHEGRALLAHELTHVVQQSGATSFAPGGTNESRVKNQEKARSATSVLHRQVSSLGSDVETECQYHFSNAEQIETAAAKRTLRKSSKVADKFTEMLGGLSGRGEFTPTVLDSKYWFAKLYELITYYEITERDKFEYPSFVMHFVPIFYDIYYDALRHYLNDEFDKIHDKWLRHFEQTGSPDGTTVADWMSDIRTSIETGVKAHIKGDMETALRKAYTSYVEKYCLEGVSFNVFREDFFQTNKEIFEKVKAAFFIEMAKKSPSPLSVEATQFTFGAGEAVTGLGLPVERIYEWRAQAWRSALDDLQSGQ